MDLLQLSAIYLLQRPAKEYGNICREGEKQQNFLLLLQ